MARVVDLVGGAEIMSKEACFDMLRKWGRLGCCGRLSTAYRRSSLSIIIWMETASVFAQTTDESYMGCDRTEPPSK